MSAFREAVAEWNRRYKDDGYKSHGVDLECPKCQQPRLVTVTTIFGRTTGHCNCCAFTWEIEP